MSRFSAFLLFALGLAAACGAGFLLGNYAPRLLIWPLEAIFFTLLLFSFLFNRAEDNLPLFSPALAVMSAIWLAEAPRFSVMFMGDIALFTLPIGYVLALIFFARALQLRHRHETDDNARTVFRHKR